MQSKGAQPEIFQGMEGIVRLAPSYKPAPQEKLWEFFLLYTLKTTFLLENLTQRWTQSGHF